MTIIWTIIIGFVAGVLAKLISPGPNEPSGFILTTILGIVGAIVANVLRGSPADKAGLTPLGRDSNGKIQLGDIIVAVDDKPIADGDDLLNVLDEKQPGDKLRMTVINNGTERTVTVTLGLLQE